MSRALSFACARGERQDGAILRNIDQTDGRISVVAEDPPIVRAETARLGTVVENEQVAQLPLNGRQFIMLAGIAPGVALPPNSVLPRINGGRPRTNEYLFDGISVLQPEPGQVAFVRSPGCNRSPSVRRRSSVRTL
jgi:hypothetical protein